MHKVQHFKSNVLTENQMEEIVNVEYFQAQLIRDSNDNLTLESNMLLNKFITYKTITWTGDSIAYYHC